MKRFLNLFVAITFATILMWSNVPGFEASGQDEEEPRTAVAPANELERLIATGVQGMGALAGGLAAGGGTWLLTYWMLKDATGLPGFDEMDYASPALGGLAVGYCAGFPLGSALGAASVAKVAEQGGSFWWSWVGAELGTISALLLTKFLSDSPLRLFVPAVVVGGPVAGALIGYNHSRPSRGQTAEGQLQDSPNGGGPQFSYCLPEISLQHHRFTNTFRDAGRTSPTLTCRLTIARLNF